jgi:hypothetical protein
MRPGPTRDHVEVAFTKRTSTTAVPTDPEQLFRLLSGASGAPAGLWVHQAEILREWHSNFSTTRDVAIELPTGAGKTLVGALIGEYRRRTADERVVYVCATRQLARQIYERLSTYGVPTVLLIGKTTEFDRAARARYTSGQAIAVTVYHHVFNSNSAFSDAQYLILDDAHAAEGPVASAWSIEIPRSSSCYHDIVSALADAFDPILVSRLRTDTPDGQFLSQVYLASPVGVAKSGESMEAVIDTATRTGALDKDVKYTMRLMRGHLGRCMVYASYNSLLIRPFIAPTATLRSFDNPTQRLYMSATLGSGGELERSFGRRKIDRIPAPIGWDKQGTGRRFFCFPELTTDLSRSKDLADKWIRGRLQAAGRVVVLTPDNRTAKRFEASRLPAAAPVVRAGDVEDDLGVFTSKDHAALVLTNRYDGVDLPNDDCRLVVLQGLPARGDLQERFLHGSLGALEVLQERIRARIVQGAGRATRNSGDYAAVLALGNDLTSFLTRSDVLAALHPEVHAEVDFGLDYSLGASSAEMTENLEVFDKHDDEWKAVEADIVADRDKINQVEPPGAKELAAAAGEEVAASLAAWQGERERALRYAKAVIDALRGGKAPQRYAALWNYLAACWSIEQAEASGDTALRAVGATYYRAARAAGRGTTWLNHLASPSDAAVEAAASTEHDPLDVAAAVKIIDVLPTLGRAGRFDSDVAEIRSGLLAAPPRPYEQALVQLGAYAGTSDSNGDGGATAAPDAAWIFGSQLWVAWEAKSDAAPAGELGADDVRQAGGHLRYIAAGRNEPIPSGSVSLLITPQATTHPSAVAIAEDHVHLVHPNEVVELLDGIVRAWRAVRPRSAGATVDDVLAALERESALPSQWLARLTARPLKRQETI